MRIVSAKTGKVRVLRAHASASASTTARSASARSGSPSRATNQLVRLDASTGRPSGNPIKLPYSPGAIAVANGRRLGRARSRRRAPGPAAQARPEDRPDARQRRLSVRDHVARRRARPRSGSPPAAAPAIQRVDLKTGKLVKDDPRRRQPHRGHRLPPRRALGRRRRTTTPSTRSTTETGDVDPDQRRPAARASSRSTDGTRLRHQLQLERPLRDRREDLARRRRPARRSRSTRSRSRSTATARCGSAASRRTS